MRNYIVVFLFCFTIAPLSSSSNNVTKYLSNLNGLTNNSVNCIFEDSENIVWIGTWDGLNAHNGRDIRTFRYNRSDKHSISNNVIRQILEQSNDCLWIATDYGVNRWDKKKQIFTNYFLGTENKIPKQENSYILSITSHNTVVCFVKGHGLFVYDTKTDKFELIEDSLKDKVRYFIMDNEDNIYFLLNNGKVITYQLRTGQNGKLALSVFKEIEYGISVQKIFFSENKIFLASANRIIVINKRHDFVKDIQLDVNKTISYVLSFKNKVYISFYEGQCITHDLTTNIQAVIKDVPGRISIFTMYAGSQDILWVGSDGQGVLMMYRYEPLFDTVICDHPVRSFCENGSGRVLVGTKGGGIKLLNKTINKLADYLTIKDGLISNSVYTIKRNQANDLFIGTEGEGINILYANSNRLEKLQIPYMETPFKAVYGMHFTNNDSILWLGTSGHGLIKISLHKENNRYIVSSINQFVSTDQNRSINNDVIYAIFQANKKNELWFGTRGGGINKIDINTNKIEKLEDNILTNNDVLSIQNTKDALWIGTSYGLNKIQMDGDSLVNTQYTDNEGLNNNTIHGILEDESGNIWVSTNLGLSFINISTNKIENYTIKDGLQSDEFADGAFYTDQNKFLYFGGVNGYNYFKPDNIQRRYFTPTLRLNNFRIYNTPCNINEHVDDGELRLSYNERYITFGFIANDFINNENCEYAYRLINLSEEWINNGNNSHITFSELPPGKYTLEVRSTNGDKVWADNIYTLQINVSHPWWLSTYAIIAYIIILSILTYIIQSVIKNRIRLNRQILLEQIDKLHQQKVHESKLNFFTNVAHEFFTPLTLIYGPAQHLLDTGNIDSYTKRYIQIIKNNAERMQKLITELMEFRKAKSGHTAIYPENIDINLLADYISDNYQTMSEENKIDYQVEVKNEFSIYSDRDFLEKIFFNLFSNAFKYTPRNGYIYVNVWKDEENGYLHMNIKNSGSGLTAQQMSEIFDKYKIFDTPKLSNTVSTGVGLNLTKSLVELLGGTITVSGKQGEYVEFSVQIPALEGGRGEETLKKEETAIEKRQNTTNSVISKKDITILIVDDERNIRELLKDILSPIYSITEAADGHEALEIVEQNHPDIIISDVLMPNLDGMSLINRLRANPKTMYIPIISISAKTAIEDRIDAYEHGADLYITKPFHPRHILSTIENLIKKQGILKEYFNSSISSIKIKDGVKMHQDDKKMIYDIAAFIQQNIEDESLSPNSIADFMGVSKATLYRNFKDILDSTPSEFIRNIRLEHAAKLLVSTKHTVSEIMFKAGFSNKSYFYREFAKQYNLSPKGYRDKETTE